MKNKDRYDLRFLTGSVITDINGCGKRITKQPRMIEVCYDNKVVAKFRSDKPLVDAVMEWLEIE